MFLSTLFLKIIKTFVFILKNLCYTLIEVMSMDLGERIKSERRRAKMTQSELAEQLNIPYQRISQYERGVRIPKRDMLDRIASALGVTAAYLLGETTSLPSVDVLSSESMAVFCEHLDSYLDFLNKENSGDVLKKFGTNKPYQEIINSQSPISLKNAAKIAESLGVSLQYLLGETDDITPDLSPFIESIRAEMAGKDIDPEVIRALESMRVTFENDTILHATSIQSHAKTAIEKALKKLDSYVLEVCRDENAVTEVQKLNELQDMPIRIDHVIDYIKAKRNEIIRDMPGIIPPDTTE